MGFFKGDADVNTGMAEAKRIVSAGIKQLKIAKCKVCLGQFYRGMHQRNAP